MIEVCDALRYLQLTQAIISRLFLRGSVHALPNLVETSTSEALCRMGTIIDVLSLLWRIVYRRTRFQRRGVPRGEFQVLLTDAASLSRTLIWRTRILLYDSDSWNVLGPIFVLPYLHIVIFIHWSATADLFWHCWLPARRKRHWIHVSNPAYFFTEFFLIFSDQDSTLDYWQWFFILISLFWVKISV